MPTPSRRSDRPSATLPQLRRRRAGAFAWAVLLHFVAALLLGGPVAHAPRRASASGEPGIRPRDLVELFAAHQRDGAANEIAPKLRHPTQPPRAGTDAGPFVAATRLDLAAAASSPQPAEAAAPDPRGARRPDHYANAPPSPGRDLT